MTHRLQWPALGFGAGLRTEHYEDVLAGGAPTGSVRSSEKVSRPLTWKPKTGPWKRFQPAWVPMAIHNRPVLN